MIPIAARINKPLARASIINILFFMVNFLRLVKGSGGSVIYSWGGGGWGGGSDLILRVIPPRPPHEKFPPKAEFSY